MELWKLNSSQSVRIPFPDHKLYLTEDELSTGLGMISGWQNNQPARYNNCKWLLDPSSTPQYLVGIIPFNNIVLVFNQLNDPQFLHRMVWPYYDVYICPRLITTTGVEQTALVIGSAYRQNIKLCVSDLVNDFQKIPEWVQVSYYNVITNNCIYHKGYRPDAIGQMLSATCFIRQMCLMMANIFHSTKSK